MMFVRAGIGNQCNPKAEIVSAILGGSSVGNTCELTLTSDAGDECESDTDDYDIGCYGDMMDGKRMIIVTRNKMKRIT
jgi:hypothetical protein